eukprot:TRINITY_DN2442_c0_g1_i1.p1 TRINITY_DN2442_c0_g1~~TRINITY_DN2442_c0_g1_i1.p1  ORF type:complete len:170 (+),score=19.82 TRINITY_DN2442_c0_g1_i1:349-858(+)
MLDEEKFDVVTCFNEVGNSFQSSLSARTFLHNAACRLKPGGLFFGILPDSSSIWYKAQKGQNNTIRGELYTITFDNEQFTHYGTRYTLSMQGTTTHEHLVHFPTFISLAKSESLKMLEITNFSEFFEDNKKNYGDKLKALNVLDKKGKFQQSQSDIIGLYTMFIFEKEK